MASQSLSRAIEKLDQYLQRSRGSVGSPKAVNILNDLVSIQRFVQENGKNIQNFQMVQKRLGQVKELLGMGEGASE